MKCYCISGLGADKRAFKHLDINLELIHIEWTKPLKNESISSYSKRLLVQIDTKEPFLLLGLSFGGIIASELAQITSPEKVIHISSIINRKHLPLIFRIIGFIGIHKIIPAKWLSPPMGIANWIFGLKKTQNKTLFTEIISDSDKDFLKWAIEQLLGKEIHHPKNLIRIHGTNDKLLPLSDSNDIITIKDGGHLMILEQYNDVNEALIKALSNN